MPIYFVRISAISKCSSIVMQLFSICVLWISESEHDSFFFSQMQMGASPTRMCALRPARLGSENEGCHFSLIQQMQSQFESALESSIIMTRSGSDPSRALVTSALYLTFRQISGFEGAYPAVVDSFLPISAQSGSERRSR